MRPGPYARECSIYATLAPGRRVGYAGKRAAHRRTEERTPMVMERQTTGRWVDKEHGLVSPDIFLNQDIYDQELEQIFARAWLFVRHDSQIPNAGDYVLGRMGEETVIVVRDNEQKVHIFLNRCRHRGNRVCRYDEGNTGIFT